VVDRVVIVPLIQKLEIVSAFSPDCRKKNALAPNLQLLQLDKVSHENLTLKSFFLKKFQKRKKSYVLKGPEKNSLLDSLKTLIPIFDF
jgi:hypothetical protein